MMKMILYMAMSVNGYIATLQDEAPWSSEVWEAYYKLVGGVGATIVGRRTYEFMQEAGEFEKLGFPLTVVVSHAVAAKENGSEKTFFVESPQAAIELMQSKGVTEVIIGGGGKLNAGFLEQGLLDEIILDIDPVIFGQGIRLFDEVDVVTQLKLLTVKHLSQDTLRLKYSVLK